MNSLRYRLLVWVFCCSTALAVNASALDAANLPKSIERDGQSLHLNGAGVRSKFVFDIYVVGLYLPAPQTDASAPTPKGQNSDTMRVHLLAFVHRK